MRIGLATARALGVAWNVPVRGYPTLALVAAMARSEEAGEVTVCMNGGHGEWFMQDFDAAGLPTDELSSVSPAAAAQRAIRPTIAGSRAEELAALLDRQPSGVVKTLPEAAKFQHLPEALLSEKLSPLYGRAPDAKLPSR